MKHLLILSLTFFAAAFASEVPSNVLLALDAAGARPARLSLGGTDIALTGDGGFRVTDATNKAPVRLPSGKLSDGDAKPSFTTTAAGNLRLSATFEQTGDRVVVRGEIENLRGDERGFIVDYRIPRLGPGARFSSDLRGWVGMDKDTETESNAFPVAAMCTANAGVAMAIPPDEPRVFGVVADRSGMSIRFYLGTSPKPRRFPNRASFVFIIYAVEPSWGFRSALSRYYAFHPDFYKQRLKKEGLMMFQMTDRNPPNIDQYGFELSESQWGRAVLASAIARDERNGIATFPYMIVGQREIKYLPSLPKTYEEAMAAYDRWNVADQAPYNHTKENAASQGDSHLKEEVTSSALQGPDGRYTIVIRDTLWGKNSVTFKTNPNPDLFADKGGTNVGKLALDVADRWMKMHPEYDGMFVDSLGANWPAALNYRPDHFVYARYPLTFDPEGRVALYNAISHYEYIETLRKKMYATGRLTLGNGVYAYKARGAPPGKAGDVEVQINNATTTAKEFYKARVPAEHYRVGSKVSRFFCAALLDVASSEFGVKSTVEQHQDVRVIMGPKPYAFLNYHWNDGRAVEEFVNKSLGFGIFASTSTDWNTGVQYESNPDGYGRDKPLLDWFVPLVRMLSAAGWQPVTYATVAGEDVTCERFGRGKTVYLSLYNDADKPRDAVVTIDLDGLGFGDRPVAISEIARHSDLYRSADGALHLKMEPRKAYIIEIKSASD